jgi:hypothetical protein
MKGPILDDTLNSLLLEQSIWQDNRATTIKKRWNPQTMYQAYRHLLEAQNLYDLSKVKTTETYAVNDEIKLTFSKACFGRSDQTGYESTYGNYRPQPFDGRTLRSLRWIGRQRTTKRPQKCRQLASDLR